MHPYFQKDHLYHYSSFLPWAPFLAWDPAARLGKSGKKQENIKSHGSHLQREGKEI